MAHPEYPSPTDLPTFEHQDPETETVTLMAMELVDESRNTALRAGKLTCSAATEAVEQPTLRQRFARSKLARFAFGGLTVAGMTAVTTFEASPAFADDNPVYTVVNPDNDGTRSIYDRNSPNWADSSRTAPDFAYYGDRIELICGMDGEAVGPNSNKRWHYARNLSRPDAGVTWIPDRYTNTPNKANEPTPGEEECLAPPPESPKEACYFNLMAPSEDLTFYYGGDQRYLGNAWQAAENWTDAGVGISIEQTNRDDAYIIFKDVYSDEDFFGRAVIPITPEWMGPHKTPPKNPKRPDSIVIEMNQRLLDIKDVGDFLRTYTAGHEIGHALGIAHPELCGDDSSVSLMNEGDLEELKKREFNTPMPYDKLAIEQLY